MNKKSYFILICICTFSNFTVIGQDQTSPIFGGNEPDNAPKEQPLEVPTIRDVQNNAGRNTVDTQPTNQIKANASQGNAPSNNVQINRTNPADPNYIDPLTENVDIALPGTNKKHRVNIPSYLGEIDGKAVRGNIVTVNEQNMMDTFLIRVGQNSRSQICLNYMPIETISQNFTEDLVTLKQIPGSNCIIVTPRIGGQFATISVYLINGWVINLAIAVDTLGSKNIPALATLVDLSGLFVLSEKEEKFRYNFSIKEMKVNLFKFMAQNEVTNFLGKDNEALLRNLMTPDDPEIKKKVDLYINEKSFVDLDSYINTLDTLPSDLSDILQDRKLLDKRYILSYSPDLEISKDVKESIKVFNDNYITYIKIAPNKRDNLEKFNTFGVPIVARLDNQGHIDMTLQTQQIQNWIIVKDVPANLILMFPKVQGDSINMICVMRYDSKLLNGDGEYMYFNRR